MLILTRLSGFGGGSGPRSNLNTFEMVDSVSATGTLNYPSNVLPGDLIVRTRSYSAQIGGPGAGYGLSESGMYGWQAIDRHVSGVAQNAWFATSLLRVCFGGETGSTPNGAATIGTVESSGGASTGGSLLVRFRANAPIRSAVIRSVNGQRTTGDPSQQTISSASSAGPMTVAIAFYNGTSAIGARTWSGAFTSEIGGGSGSNQVWCKWKVYTPGETPANHTVDMGDAGTNYLASCYLELS